MIENFIHGCEERFKKTLLVPEGQNRTDKQLEVLLAMLVEVLRKQSHTERLIEDLQEDLQEELTRIAY